MRWKLGLVALPVLIAFSPVLGADFVNFDDDVNFTSNAKYRGLGPEQLKWMFSDIQGHYMPLTWLTLGLDYTLWGMDARGYHATSLLIHGVNAVLFALVLNLLFRLVGKEESGWAVAAGSLFFALHPLRVESVAWVTERRDVVSGFFFLLSIWAYLKAREREAKRVRYLALSVVCAAASMLSKTMSMGLVFVLLILDVWPLKRLKPGADKRPVLLEKLPYFAVFVGAALLTWVSTRAGGAMVDSGKYSMAHSLIQPGHRVLFYVVKTLFPVQLSPIYTWFNGRPAVQPLYVFALLAFIGLFLALILMRKRWPGALAAWLMYCFLIAPVCGVFQAGPHYAADRYSYVATLPFAGLVATVLLHAKTSGRAIAFVALGVFGLMSFVQAGVWKNSMTLWNHVLSFDPDNPAALQNRAFEYMRARRFNDALRDLDRCVQVVPTHLSAIETRGLARYSSGRLKEAMEDMEAVLRAKPDSAVALTCRGAVLLREGRLDDSLRDLNAAIKANPAYRDALEYRGTALQMKGDLRGAIADYDAALATRPDNVEIIQNRALAKRTLGDLAGSLRDLDEALASAPNSYELLYTRGTFLSDVDAPRAVRDLIRALEAAPADWPDRAAAFRQLEALRRDK